MKYVRNSQAMLAGAASFVILAVLATIVWLQPSGVKSEAVVSPWPLVDGQTMPTGVVEEIQATGMLRNLGVIEAPWSDDPVAQLVVRSQVEPLFAISLAQEFGGEASKQVGFWGLSGLWNENWTEPGNSFLKLLESEIQERFLGLADSLPPGKMQVVMANAERDAVRLTFTSEELVSVGKLVVFRTECGQVAVDERGNLYVPCDCGKFRTYSPPPPSTPPSTTTPSTTSTTVPTGKDAELRPEQDPVISCPPGQYADRVTGTCTTSESGSPPPTYDNSGGDSGPGAPGSGVTTPTTDPAPDPTVPTAPGGDGFLPDPGV